jgi:hypothetical protein
VLYKTRSLNIQMHSFSYWAISKRGGGRGAEDLARNRASILRRHVNFMLVSNHILFPYSLRHWLYNQTQALLFNHLSKLVSVLNEAPRHEDEMGEWRHNSTHSWLRH